MPQMMPYSWMLIFLISLSLLIFLINFNYFFYLPCVKTLNYCLQHQSSHHHKWTWKW